MDKKTSSNFNITFNTTLLVTVIISFLYISGWIFANAYFSKFQIGLLGVEISKEYFFIYGFWVVLNYWWLILIYFLFIMILFSFRKIQDYFKYWSSMFISLLPILLVGLLLLGLYLAESTAKEKYIEQQKNDFPNYPNVRVWLKETTIKDKIFLQIQKDLPKGCYRLLFQNKGTLFLFKPHREEQTPYLATLEISQSEINAIRILPLYESCK